MTGGAVAAAVLLGLAAACAAAAVVPPLPRLAPRLRPYNSANRTRLGKSADVTPAGRPAHRNTLAAVFAPMVASVATSLSRLVDAEGDEQTQQRLRQADAWPDCDPHERLHRYRLQRLGYLAAALATATLLTVAAGTTVGVLAFVGLTVSALTLPRARLDSAIEAKRRHMVIDLHAAAHHLAMSQKTGSAIHDSLQRLVARGRGPVVDELAEALTWARSGKPLADALRLAAERSPERDAARVYKALARAAETGSAIGDALRDLSEEVRENRRDALQRVATRRRNFTYVAIVFLLIPPLVLLLFAPMYAEIAAFTP